MYLILMEFRNVYNLMRIINLRNNAHHISRRRRIHLHYVFHRIYKYHTRIIYYILCVYTHTCRYEYSAQCTIYNAPSLPSVILPSFPPPRIIIGVSRVLFCLGILGRAKSERTFFDFFFLISSLYFLDMTSRVQPAYCVFD